MTDKAALHDELDGFNLGAHPNAWWRRALIHALIDLGRVERLECAHPTCIMPARAFDPACDGRAPSAVSIDHVEPQSCGGTHRPENLRLVHKACNSLTGQSRSDRRSEGMAHDGPMAGLAAGDACRITDHPWTTDRSLVGRAVVVVRVGGPVLGPRGGRSTGPSRAKTADGVKRAEVRLVQDPGEQWSPPFWVYTRCLERVGGAGNLPV